MSAQPDTYNDYRSLIARVASTVRHHGPDSPEAAAARAELEAKRPAAYAKRDESARDLAALKLEDHARRVAAKAPPLTDEQIGRIAAILSGAR